MAGNTIREQYRLVCYTFSYQQVRFRLHHHSINRLDKTTMVTNIIWTHCTIGRHLLDEFEGEEKMTAAAIYALIGLAVLIIRVYLESKKKK